MRSQYPDREIYGGGAAPSYSSLSKSVDMSAVKRKGKMMISSKYSNGLATKNLLTGSSDLPTTKTENDEVIRKMEERLA